MRGRRFLVAGILAGGLLLGANPCGAGDGERKEPAKPWDDAALVERRFSEACAAVEAIRGAPFERRPTVKAGPCDECKRRCAESPVQGWFDTKENVVHLVTEVAPDSMHGQPWRVLEPEAWMRLVFAHEVTHAWDAARFSWRVRVERGELDPETAALLGNLEEGHAHHVASRAAAIWGMAAEFRAFEAPYVRPEDPSPSWILGPAADPFGTDLRRFKFVTCRAFLAAVEKADGAAGIARVFHTPPRRSRAIEFPPLWLAGATPPVDPIADRALAAMRAAFPSGAGWSAVVEDVWPVAVRADVWFVGRGDELAEAFEAGRGLWAFGSDDREVVGAVRRFRDEAAARAFARGWSDSIGAFIRVQADWRIRWEPLDANPETARVDTTWTRHGDVGRLEFERVGRYVVHVAQCGHPPYYPMAPGALDGARRAILAEGALPPADKPR